MHPTIEDWAAVIWYLIGVAVAFPTAYWLGFRHGRGKR